MAQILTIGDYLVELDGATLTFRDHNGQMLGETEIPAGENHIVLPHGETLPLEALTEQLSANQLAEFQTAAGATEPGSQIVDDGSSNFAAFDPLAGLGGLDAIGGLNPTELQYGLIERAGEIYRSDEEHGHDDDTSSLIPMPLPPHVSATDGSIDFNITHTTGQQNPLGDQTVGDYLSTGGGPNDSVAVDPAMVNGVDNSNLTMAEAAEVRVNFVSEFAACHSLVGFYTFDANGNINPGSVQFLWLDGSQVNQGTPHGELAQDFLGNSQPDSVSLGTLDAGTRFGFFIVADDPASPANHDLISSVAGITPGSDDYAADLAAINAATTFGIDANGNGQILVNGQPLSGGTYFTHDPTLNNDSNDADINHAISGVTTVADGQLYVGFEDLPISNPWFDRDYNDLVISVDMGPYNITRLTQHVIQPTVDFSNPDNANLSSVVITTSNFTVEDSLHYMNDARFDVATVQNGNDVTITITAHNGTETVDAFEDYVNAIYFATSGMTEGERHIGYQITDEDGHTSNLETIGVTVSVTEVNPLLVSAFGESDEVVQLETHAFGRDYNGEDQDTGYEHQDTDGQTMYGHEADNTHALVLTDVVATYHDDSIFGTDEPAATDLPAAGADHGIDHGAGVEFGADFGAYAPDDGIAQAMTDLGNLMAQTVI